MYRARAFFYVCAGLVLLAVTYHLGAQTAVAQSGAAAFDLNGNYAFTCAIGRTVYVRTVQGEQDVVAEAVPGTAPIVATASNGEGAVVVGLEDGDLYYNAYNSSLPGWVYRGNLFSGATPAQRESFGAMKSRYRGAAQPESQTK